jgi:hypothetical protein
MALIGNRSVLHKSPGRFLNGGPAILRSAFNNHGMQRNAYQAFDAKAATPYGHLSPSAWVLPKRAGGLSSRNVTGLTLAPIGLAVGGVTSNATASISFTVADAAGQLISSGNGTASFTISALPLLLTASINGAGSSSFTLATNAPLLGAIADGYGATTITITAAPAQAFPLNDASPLRTATANFAINGALTPYAIGSLSGNTVDTSILTVDAITSGVWQALATDYASAGTMGSKLNSAASGGVDYTALGLAVWSSVSRTLTEGAAPDTAAITAAVIAGLQATTIPVDALLMNGATIQGDGTNGNPWRGVGVSP